MGHWSDVHWKELNASDKTGPTYHIIFCNYDYILIYRNVNFKKECKRGFNTDLIGDTTWNNSVPLTKHFNRINLIEQRNNWTEYWTLQLIWSHIENQVTF